MTYSNTWTFALNTSPVDSSPSNLAVAVDKSFLLQLKNFLVGSAGWSVVQSCDSTSISSSDLLASNSNINISNTTLTWIVLKSPAGIVAGFDGSYTGDQSCIWLTLATGLSASAPYYLEVTWHRVAPTGGTVSASPTSASFVRASNATSLGSASQHLKNSSSAPLFHFACTSRGNFYALVSYPGTGIAQTAILCLPVTPRYMQSLAKDYPYAVALGYSYLDSGLGSLTSSLLGGYFGWAYDGFPSYVGWAVPAINGVWIGSSLSSAGGAIDGESEYSQIILYTTTTGKGARMGVLQDVFGSGQTTGQGSVDAATPTLVRLGNLWIPANTAIAL